MKTCRCTNCEKEFEDDDELELFKEEATDTENEEFFKGCPNCKTDAFLLDILEIDENNREDIIRLWELLGDIPVDEEDQIDEDFYLWEKGTDKFEIWHWFDEHLEEGLGKFLEGK